jgi:predicted nucleotidyltransferase
LSTLEKILRLLLPKFYNRVTLLIVTTGLSLFTKPIWLEFVNYGLSIYNAHHKELNLSVIGEWDWFVGLVLIFGALIWNTINRLIDLKTNQKSDPAYKSVKSKQYNSFEFLCNDIYFLLRDNEQIFKSVGPNSGEATTEELRTDLTMWYKYRIQSIIPNNQKIKEILQNNIDLLNNGQRTLAQRMILHIEAFEEHVKNPEFRYDEFRFPQEFKKLIEDTCFENAKYSKTLKNEVKWLNKQFTKLGVSTWYLFGSSILTPETSLDVDVVILIETKINLKRKVDIIKFDFKLKFKKGLHLTIFNDDEIETFKGFINQNQFKLKG